MDRSARDRHDSARKLTEIEGVDERRIRRPGTTTDVVTLALNTGFSERSAALVISAITDGSRLLFFDAEHPQRSDPGLYVYLQRVGSSLLAKGANHGWSYPWLPISDERAARWLWLCRSHNDASGSYESSVMQLSPGAAVNNEPQPQGSTGFAAWLEERLARPS